MNGGDDNGESTDDESEASEEIASLLQKHMIEEQTERQKLEERVAFYEKEFNINPLSWGKKKKK